METLQWPLMPFLGLYSISWVHPPGKTLVGISRVNKRALKWDLRSFQTWVLVGRETTRHFWYGLSGCAIPSDEFIVLNTQIWVGENRIHFDGSWPAMVLYQNCIQQATMRQDLTSHVTESFLSFPAFAL